MNDSIRNPEVPTAAALEAEVIIHPVHPVRPDNPALQSLALVPANADAPVHRTAPIPVTRPGISSEMLARAGIVHVDGAGAHDLIGMVASGSLILYNQLEGCPLIVNGQPYHRIRIERAVTNGPKYLAPANSGSQLYIPPGFRELLQRGGTLTITEGEFKALALVEAGFPAVAVSGISCSCPNNADGQPTLLPALVALIAEFAIARVEFAGDNDTALIPAFSHEMVKLKRCLGEVELVLPRIPIDAQGKGPDDLRQALGVGFPAEWERIRAGAEPVEACTTAAELAIRLLDREIEAAKRLVGRNREQVRAKLGKLGAAFNGEPLVLASINRLAKAVGVDRMTLKAEVKHAQQERLVEEQEDLLETLVGQDVTNPLLVFDGNSYYRQNVDQNWTKVSRVDALLALADKGLSRLVPGGAISPAEEALLAVQHHHGANYAGPLCGRPPGLLRLNGKKILVTEGPTHITTAPGPHPTILRVMLSLFGDGVPDSHCAMQIKLFIAWLKLARIAVRTSDRYLPGQVLGLVGPRDCGKSLLQSKIITPALGGRVADPGLWFTGKSNFNSDLWGAEHLALGDQSLGENGAQKAHLQEQLKQVVSATDYSLHPKNKEALTLTPVWRVSLSANDDPSSASSLPALDGSFADKIIYLHCYPPTAPFFDETPSGRPDFEALLQAELPGFLHTVDNYKIPVELRKARFGVIEWHHPYITDLLESNNPLNPISDVLTAWMERWMEGSTAFCVRPMTEQTISAVDLHRALDIEMGPGRFARISSNPGRLGHQLAELAVHPRWRGILSRQAQRIGGRDCNQLQTVWHFQAPGTTPPAPANQPETPANLPTP